MTEEAKNRVEKFIDDWHWDEQSHQYAFELGKFLLGFAQYLDSLNLSERTCRKHKSNLGLIGHFDCDYGYKTEAPFNCMDLEGGT
jgi:hypothetical protein